MPLAQFIEETMTSLGTEAEECWLKQLFSSPKASEKPRLHKEYQWRTPSKKRTRRSFSKHSTRFSTSGTIRRRSVIGPQPTFSTAHTFPRDVRDCSISSA